MQNHNPVVEGAEGSETKGQVTAAAGDPNVTPPQKALEALAPDTKQVKAQAVPAASEGKANPDPPAEKPRTEAPPAAAVVDGNGNSGNRLHTVSDSNAKAAEQKAGAGGITNQGTPQLTELEKRKLELTRALNDLEGEIIVADEWGVFGTAIANQSQPALPYTVLTKAVEALDAGKTKEAEEALLEGRAALNHALDGQWLWRVNNQYGLVPLLFTALFTLATYGLIFQMGFGLDLPESIKHPAFAGMVGAVLKSLYWLQFQTAKGLLRPRWFSYFIVAPLIGAILGWLISLLVSAIALIASSGSTVQTDWKTVSLLAAFAGYKWEWALNWMEESARAIQARGKETSPAKK